MQKTPPPAIIITPRPSTFKPLATTTKVPSEFLPCDPLVPITVHPKDCQKYLMCQKDPEGGYFNIEKICPPQQLYNTLLKKCDSAATVIKLRPHCDVRKPPIREPDGDEDYAEIKPPTYITLCDISMEYKEHPTSCFKFLHCSPAANGSYIYVVKTCAPDMMYNPNLKICDWPNEVKG